MDKLFGLGTALTYCCCWQDAAELLAAKADWGPLYDSAVLHKNQVPVASATYFEV